MMIAAHVLGLPRMGARRELKRAVEAYWKGEIDQPALLAAGQMIRAANRQAQLDAGLDFMTVGDFSWYDHILDMSVLLGVVPERFGLQGSEVDLDTYFRMARGRAPGGADTHACEMTKWFDANYHYIVPEFSPDQAFKISSTRLFEDIREAQAAGKPIKAILQGPLSYLWLGKCRQGTFDRLQALKNIIPVYQAILQTLKTLGVAWVQMDEPILVLDLPTDWQDAFTKTYQQFTQIDLNILLATYFGGLEDNMMLACKLPVQGLHLDLVRAPQQLTEIMRVLPADKILSAGVIDGRNIWRADLRKIMQMLQPVYTQLGERLWVSASCSLLHCPVDLQTEINMDPVLKNWLAFAWQKLHEISLLAKGLAAGEAVMTEALAESDAAVASRRQSPRIHRLAVKERTENITLSMTKRNNPYAVRQAVQKAVFNLPDFPTTTIGSFPQTQAIRCARQDFRAGKLTAAEYKKTIQVQIAHAIEKQLDLDLDVLVHGEAERNDMVEYFGELLAGFAFTSNGWVQSYGSRCVKPPIIYGDVCRTAPMTVEWITYAQSLTNKPVKGMLTGPMTILCWSFVRDDQPRFTTAKQIALALRDEVTDLVNAGIHIIQIDEPAIREGLPLRRNAWEAYLQQAVYCFQLAACCVPDSVQIHTHMCYSEFNDIIESIAALDADVITIESSRSDMELLQAFESFNYPNDIGPGIYDIHSPRIPAVREIVALMERAAKHIPKKQLWVNPDCGLKTRDWPEVEQALRNMVAAAKQLRETYPDINLQAVCDSSSV